MRLVVTIAATALGLSVATLAALWGFTQIAVTAGTPLPSMEDSWMAAVGFAAMPVAFVAFVALLLLAALWVLRDLRRVRA